MALGNGEISSLSDTVRKEINTLPHVKTGLSEGIINYSALARNLMPSLSKRLNKNLNEESVIVAIKRYADELSVTPLGSNYLEMFANSELTLQDNMAYAHFHKNDRLVKKVEELFLEENWKVGEMRIFIQGADQVMLIAKRSKVDELSTEFEADRLFALMDIALLSFRMPLQAYSLYGVIAEVTRQLAQKGISVEMVTSASDLHFLVEEKDAERAYSTLKAIIKNAQSLVEGKGK
ncbi:MAG TPA: ACT domain-containing protein [Candidatus Diapherotrites archaeon]|uniref:ACT domain-containing protein n=1 Tax=Candidatus Iainarchaeum sp. TaxID=3101447 RepID=A0A7J4IUP1_9ARCH|nr:ACT domain-containing protein [Candidatus Diapherotrites archaeon]